MVSPLTHLSLQFQGLTPRNPSQTLTSAAALFRSATQNSWLGLFWSRLTGTRHSLRSMQDCFNANTRILNAYYTGVVTVPLGQIIGSEGRNTDFDRDFNPVNENNRERWISIAVARLQGVALPLVELIRIGECYFVRDGHHRISVARALKQEYIEALVTVWENGPA